MKPNETTVRASQSRELLWEALATLKNNGITAAIKAITKAITILSVF